MQSKTLSVPHLFSHPIYINQQNLALQSSYNKCHSTYKTSKIIHRKCVIATIIYCIRMVTETICYTPIISSQVTGCGGPRLVRDHHSGSQRLYSSTPMDGYLSPYIHTGISPYIHTGLINSQINREIVTSHFLIISAHKLST